MFSPRVPVREGLRTQNLAAGARVGSYEIVALLGAGGMGEVYRARDTRLDRIVALKLLPAQVAASSTRRQRFEREARAISQLSHPHICILHDVGEAAIVTPQADAPSSPDITLPYLVMECLEGQTLAERIDRGRLPLDQVLQYAVQIADALDAAHRHGIVHRDLKPGNIMLTEAGVKLVDFGLARVARVAEDGMLPAVANDASRATLTAEGVILGTTPYMAPEQLEGLDADARSDLFAFGAVLYEMVTGRRAFSGVSEAAVVAAVLDSSPPPISGTQRIPAALEHVITTCLAKSPQDRWQNAGDVKRQLEWIAEHHQGTEASPSRPRVSRPWLWAGAALVCLTLLAGVLMYLRLSKPTDVVRFAVSVPQSLSGVEEPGFSLSPDGSRLAYVGAGPNGQDLVWIRHLDRLESQPLPGSEGAYSPFWSPDGQSVAYFAHGKLMRIPVAGGPPQELCDVTTPASVPAGAWGSDGWILFAQAFGPLHRVSALGGEASPVTTLNAERQEFGHYAPHFLPDGEHFLYIGNSTLGPTGLYVSSLARQGSQRLSSSPISGSGVSNGFLLFVEQGLLKARKFDTTRLQFTGDSATIAQTSPGFSLASNRTLAYRLQSQSLTQLTWFDRSGKKLDTIAPPGRLSAPALSPDGSKLAVGRDGDIWVIDLARGNEIRVTSDPTSENWPVWAPDGRYILYSRSSGSGPLVRKPGSGAGSEELVLDIGGVPFEWSADGRFITYFASGPATQGDLYVLPVTGVRKPVLFLQTKFQEVENRLSPDGSFMAYASNESGRLEVYVQTFPATDNKWPISSGGGAQPIWRRDGRELFYLAADGTLMAVDITTAPAFAAGAPRPLFKTNSPRGPVRNSYTPSGDGQRFLVNSYVEGGTSTIVVLVNWPAALAN